MTNNFAYFKAADGTGDVAVNTDKVSVVKGVKKREHNALIICEGDEIEVIGEVTEVAENIAAVS